MHYYSEPTWTYSWHQIALLLHMNNIDIKHANCTLTLFVTPKVIATFYPNLKLTILTLHFRTISSVSSSCTRYLTYILLCARLWAIRIGGAIANPDDMMMMMMIMMKNKKAVLWQGKPRDAAVNFDTYRILQRHRMCSFPAPARLSCWSLHTAVKHLSKW